jgi:hypothetical protein
MIPLLINQSNISWDFTLKLSKCLADSDLVVIGLTGNWANTENIRIGLVFAVLAQWKFLYCIDRFDHIKANKSKLINKMCYGALKSNIDQGRRSLGQYCFSVLHNTSYTYCTKWSAVIVLLHLTFPVFIFCTWIHFYGLFVVVCFKFKSTWVDPFNIIDTCTNSVCTNLYY